MLKVGDKVRVTKGVSNDSIVFANTIQEISKIENIFVSIKGGDGGLWYKDANHTDEIELVNQEPQYEIC